MKFYLGSHFPAWLARVEVPLFISDVRIRDRKTFPRALTEWALDSGGFSEVSKHGGWTTSAKDYAARVKRYASEIGKMEWAAPQDWMCEPEIIKGNPAKKIKGTKLSVKEHQRRTVENFLELKSIAPELPFVPVLQGWTEGEYLDCMELYASHGIDLTKEPRVGLGSVCRRQSTIRVRVWVRQWASEGLKLHGFGFKVEGLSDGLAECLASSDSLAWSFQGRRMARAGDPDASPNSMAFAPF